MTMTGLPSIMRFSTCQEPFSPWTADGHATLTVGGAGVDDGNGETVVAPLAHEQFLAGNLVARVLPRGIGQRGSLGDDVIGGRSVK